MTQGGKGRRTRRRGEVKVEQQDRRLSMREWLQERFAAAQKRKAATAHARPSGNGVTLEMKAISREAAQRDPEWVVQYMPYRDQDPPFAKNRPFVNEARDSKPGRRLRAELRGQR